VIFVGVGTFVHGFDELVEAADLAAARLRVGGFAQIGHSSTLPRHLEHARFLPPDELARRLAASRVAVCHAGMGLIGDALRAGCRLVLLPRRGATTRAHPANDQTGFAERLARHLPLRLCREPRELEAAIAAALADPGPAPAPPGSAVPAILRRFLEGSAAAGAQSRPASSS
jgi:UDP:flavonoid glycosyltransferase YjiC (YdhE family)